jgi:hypothetical protein
MVMFDPVFPGQDKLSLAGLPAANMSWHARPWLVEKRPCTASGPSGRFHAKRLISYGSVSRGTAFAGSTSKKDKMNRKKEGYEMKTNDGKNEKTAAHELRPLVMLVATSSLAVASLLVTTATLGASPVNSQQYEQTTEFASMD